ncbi:Non-canonical purine NTP pyrophosphatase [Enhygromyxa salina]|uniref:dITP/XTP pyrophosphatase n=1 Tax=Enhygromyxa salina TaxID=215803 RepID=A0A2S9XH32_9BACT|nr:non-canonical purine NTP pyrophosphatase [Enhygromyxa salina]PRP92179.1 Non-canonical purine NTP pyrophosphatase [Enhygromyxa salina]
MSPRLVIASNNQHKVAEIAAMLARARFPAVRQLEVVSAGALPEYGTPPEIDESDVTFVGNAILKANGIAGWLRDAGARSQDVVLADDSGLCVEAFDDKPGVYSARFAGPNADDEANNAKLVAELEARGLDSSAAEYVCVLAVRCVGTRPFDFTLPDAGAIFMSDNCLCVEGRCRGNVRIERRGDGGFGYDPHFWVDGDTRTFAELSASEKSQRSHRGAGMRRLVQELPLVLA